MHVVVKRPHFETTLEIIYFEVKYITPRDHISVENTSRNVCCGFIARICAKRHSPIVIWK